MLKNAEYVVSIELLCAAQAMDLFTNLKAGMGTMEGIVKSENISHLEEDRILSEDINAMCRLLHDGKIREAVEERSGCLIKKQKNLNWT